MLGADTGRGRVYRRLSVAQTPPWTAITAPSATAIKTAENSSWRRSAPRLGRRRASCRREHELMKISGTGSVLSRFRSKPWNDA
jgi:hypothetical protein